MFYLKENFIIFTFYVGPVGPEKCGLRAGSGIYTAGSGYQAWLSYVVKLGLGSVLQA
jgi:secreted trypsin-like serine protease